MPYLAFDLDAKKRAARAAAGLSVHPGQVAWGLLELWEHAWEAKSETVDALTLSCCFGPDPRVPGVLEAMGFVTAEPDGRFRVRGADRYLRITEARTKAGKARAATAKRDDAGKLVAKDAPVVLDGPTPQNQHQSSTQPAHAGNVTSGQPALTPSTEHRAVNDVLRAVAPLSADAPQQRPELTLEPVKQVRDRKPSAQEQLAKRLEDQRIQVLGNVVPDEHPVKRLNPMLQPLLKFDPDVVAEAHRLYLDDTYALDLDPPCPLPFFVSQVSRWISKATREAV